METKIIVTIGPATESEETIKKIGNAKVDFIRVNMSHSSLDNLEKIILLSDKFNIPFILDTEGAQIRTGNLYKDVILLEEGKEVMIHANEIIGDENNINLRPYYIINDLRVGDLVVLDFDTLLLKISNVSTLKDKGYITARVITHGTLGKNKSAVINQVINTLNSLPVLTSKDYQAIDLALKYDVKYIAASFIHTKEDVIKVREAVKKKMKIISKIETKQAIENLDAIIQESDYILIDRGDLSKEIPIDKIPLTQKIILKKAKDLDTPVFIATNLLESMISKPKPTRAELNDIMTSLLDGASGLALCAETAIGKYPMQAIYTLQKMIKQHLLTIDTKIQDNSLATIVSILGKINYTDNEIRGGILVTPHGGKLINRIIQNPPNPQYLDSLLKIKISESTQMDVEQIAVGAFSPLEGFMNKKDFESVLNTMRLSNGEIWTIPIILDIDEETSSKIYIGQTVALEGKDGIMALLNIEDKYTFNKDEVSEKWFGTKDKNHPGIEMLNRMEQTLIGGKIDLLKRRCSEFSEYELTPSQTRKIFEEKGWSKIIGFHTRNVIHRGHEFIQMDALKKSCCDGLFVHPCVGIKKIGDYENRYIVKSYEKMVSDFYPKDKTLLGVFSTSSRYAGPREAIFTAICRKNFGCSHFIIGRDHTGVGNYYQSNESHKIFDQFPDLGIEIVKYNVVFYSELYNDYFHEVDVPEHPLNKKKFISGTESRSMIKNNIKLPEWFIRPEISEILVNGIKNNEQIFTDK